MAFGDGTIKQQNVQQAQINPAGSVTPVSTAESSKNTIVPVAIDDELLKLLGLTPEKYALLTPEEKAEVNNKINQIKNPADKTNFGIPGLSIEKTTTEAADGKLTSIENPVEVKAEVQNKENSIIKRDDTPKPTITEKAWREMSPEQRFAYVQAKMNEHLKDIPEDQKAAARLELLDNRIKKIRGFSDEKWANMPENRKERIRSRVMTDFAVMIETGFSDEDIQNLSYSQQLGLRIEVQTKQYNFLQGKIENLQKEVDANPENSELEAKLKEFKDEAVKFEYSIKKNSDDQALSIVLEKRNEQLEKSGVKNSYEGILSEFNNQIRGNNLKKHDRCEAFISYIENDKLAGLSDKEKKYAKEAILLAIHKEKPEYVLHLISHWGMDQKGLQAMFENGVSHEMTNVLNGSADYLEQNGTEEFDDQQTIGITNFMNAAAAASPECTDAAVVAGKAMARDGRDNAVELISSKAPDAVQNRFHELVKSASNDEDRIKYFAMINNIRNNSTRQDQVKRGLEGASADVQVKSQEAYLEKGSGDKFALHGFNDALAEKIIEKDAQVPFAQNTMDATQYLSDADAVEVQKGLADANASGVDAENQDDIYKIVMSSKFDEVQEYAASNIYKLDESVRDWASDYTKSLGKENLNDAIRTEPPAPDNSSDAASSVEQNYSSNEIPSQDSVSPVNFDDTPVETPQSEEQTVQMQEELKKIDLNSAEAAQKFVEIVDKYNVQFSNYLAGLSQGQRTKMIELYCKNASPAKIFTFLKDNLSFYQTILNSAGTKLNMYKDDIFKLLKGKESNTVALATELGIDIMEYAKTNKEEAPDLAIVTKNTELARNILLNPGFYNYQPGSSVHQKLLELASDPKHNKKSDNSEMGNNLQIKA